MKNWTSLLLLFVGLTAITCLSVSCGDKDSVEDVDYIVNVAIITPNNNASFSSGESFTVEVDYKRSGNLVHNVKVEIIDASGNTVTNLVDRHAHVADAFTFKQDNVVLNSAGTYTIRASTTDLVENGESNNDSKNMVEHTIVVQ